MTRFALMIQRTLVLFASLAVAIPLATAEPALARPKHKHAKKHHGRKHKAGCKHRKQDHDADNFGGPDDGDGCK